MAKTTHKGVMSIEDRIVAAKKQQVDLTTELASLEVEMAVKWGDDLTPIQTRHSVVSASLRALPGILKNLESERQAVERQNELVKFEAKCRLYAERHKESSALFEQFKEIERQYNDLKQRQKKASVLAQDAADVIRDMSVQLRKMGVSEDEITAVKKSLGLN